MRLGDYECKTTFWMDFSIAEKFGGKAAIRDTYRRAFKEWQKNTEYLTELVMVLNWKMWNFHDRGNTELSRLYQELYEKTWNWGLKHLKGEDIQYFIRTLD